MPRNTINQEPKKPKFWEFWKFSNYKKEMVAYRLKQELIKSPEAIKALKELDQNWLLIKKQYQQIFSKTDNE